MRTLTLVAIFLAASGLALAAPKSKPATAEDGSAPRAALLMYDKLVGPNETEKALPLYYATTARERALAAVMAKLDGAIANLRQRAAAKYGPEIADAMVRSVNSTTAEDINAAKIQVAGDTASVYFLNASEPTTMIRVNGEWKISVKAIAQDIGSNLREFRKRFTRFAATVNQIAAKIQQGQFATAEEPSKQLLEAYKTVFPSAAAPAAK